MRRNILRGLYITVGSLALLSGIIGIFLPILPTTPFLLLATFCFSRSSERMHNWIINHRVFGPPILDWQTHRVINPRAKILAVGSICVGLVSIYFTFPADLWIGKYSTMIIMVATIIFILMQKSYRDPNV